MIRCVRTSTKGLRERVLNYEKCRESKCIPSKLMEKELKNYSKSVKRKCGNKYSRMTLKQLKNVSAQEWKVHNKCTSKYYNRSRYHEMDKKQTRCLKKNCNYMQLFYPRC